MAKYAVDPEFRSICKEIALRQLAESEWAQIESSDMFQSGNYSGGFDADEGEFCFSVYLPTGEYWFQVSLRDLERIANGEDVVLDIRKAE